MNLVAQQWRDNNGLQHRIVDTLMTEMSGAEQLHLSLFASCTFQCIERIFAVGASLFTDLTPVCPTRIKPTKQTTRNQFPRAS